ncbi:MAG: hypothetical protein ACNI3C_08625 [Candidatus Marinarcus sp.]|uniref:hypothetical protein n=1 Tax=Candidatus Marinarcus sp. TaxID=3100987 RepID=UPI003B00E046
MKTLVALEHLIKENEERVKLQTRQLSNHESGERKLSRVVKASIETSLEETKEVLAKYKAELEELLQQDRAEVEEKERLQAAIERKKYFDNQNLRINNNIEISSDQKLEAMLILDELPIDINIDDNELIDIATKSLELNLTNHIELNEKFVKIKQEFQSLLRGCKNEKLKEIGLLNVRIPILILHFSTLVENIVDALDIENKPAFKGLPRYEDWWIHELWRSHQAYFALYKWREIICNLCITSIQKRAWFKIFDQWVFIKKTLDDKEELAFEYTFAFDALLRKHANLEEELDSKNLLSMEAIIKSITSKENFCTVGREHDVTTLYLKFKRKKLEEQDLKE